MVVPIYCSWGAGIGSLLTHNIQADNMDYVEWKHGFRAEGAVASLQSFIIKASVGIGSALGLYALAIIGFDENFVTETAKQGLYFIMYALPAFFSIISILVWTFGYNLTEDIRKQMQKDLAELRAGR
jgi:GPH family glycoside/pentoside/hexuronide:cation symporter/glucuronide carrier protein